MNSEKLEAVRRLAKDLTRDKPRSPRQELGGYPIAARALDKCRASLAGINGEFEFNCPMDQQFFAASGIDAKQFCEFVATGADDRAVANWIRKHEHSAVS